MHGRPVEELRAGDGNPELHRFHHRPHGFGQARKGTDGGGHRLGHRMQAHRELGDHAQSAFRADEKAGEIVPGGRLPRAARGPHHLPVRQHGGERDHLVAHRAVTHRGRPRRARGRHPAERRIGPRIDREEEARAAEFPVQLPPRHPGLDRRVEVVRAHGQHAVHGPQVDRDPAAHRLHVPLDRGAGPEGDHRRAPARAGPHREGNLFGGLGENHPVGRDGGGGGSRPCRGGRARRRRSSSGRRNGRGVRRGGGLSSGQRGGVEGRVATGGSPASGSQQSWYESGRAPRARAAGPS